jgi:16S rRNA (adenine1518-N6/adenine1519-N6)-dimethyltransferase
MTTRRERLLEKIRQSGTGPKRSLGQNFLIADHVIERILENAFDFGDSVFWSKAEAPKELIEIGPGLGALTEGLIEGTSERGIGFQVIELDRQFAESWRSLGLRVLEGDALKLNWKEMGLSSGTRLISNLPYQISASLVIDRSVWPCGIGSMILMFQKEVAKRITAKEKSEDYGLLSVIAQLAWEVETVCDAGPQDFYPPPRVASRVLRFRRKFEAPSEYELAAFLKFAKRAYAHRRKLLASNLSNGSESRSSLEFILESMGFSKTVRAEELSPSQLFELAKKNGSLV